MNKCYSGVETLKSSLSLSGVDLDTRLLRALESASEIIETLTERSFVCTEEARYFDGNCPLDIDDCLSILEFKTDEDYDLDYDNTLVETTDYILYPLRKLPRNRVKLALNSAYSGFGGSGDKSVKLTGVWGFALSATPYKDSGNTVASITVSSTTLTPSAMTNFEAGQTIRVESEQMYVSAKGTTTLTVERGVNGTAAAIHTTKSIYIYYYPADIARICLFLAGMLFNNEGKTQESERLGDYSYNLLKQLPEIERSILESYKKVYFD